MAQEQIDELQRAEECYQQYQAHTEKGDMRSALAVYHADPGPLLSAMPQNQIAFLYFLVLTLAGVDEANLFRKRISYAISTVHEQLQWAEDQAAKLNPKLSLAGLDDSSKR